MRSRITPSLILLFAGLALTLPGCARSSPFSDRTEKDLRRAMVDSIRREANDAGRSSAPVVTSRNRADATLDIKPEVLPELNKMAGPDADRQFIAKAGPSRLGNDLTGRTSRTVTYSLKRAIKSAVDNNVPIQFARLGPAISEAQVIAAEAAFDWTLFSDLRWNNIDSPRVGTAAAGSTNFTPGSDQNQSLTTQTGLRRTLVSGGRLTIQGDVSYTDNETKAQAYNPDPASQLGLSVQIDQPLLRNFGSEVSQAEVRVARNAERNAVQTLRRDLIRTVSDVEKIYWQLYQAHRDLAVLQRLLDRGNKTLDQLKKRSEIDANNAQISEARARIQSRSTDVLRAQTQIRLLSDQLKQLIADPQIPVGSEIVVEPSDETVDAPVKFSLLDSIRSAIQYRPEIQQAILGIDDASIRRIVADSARLPDLTARLQTRFGAIDDNMGDAYGQLFDGSFVDYVIGLSFEMPLGNRRGEAEFRRRTLERMQTTLAYRNAVQQAVVDVKSALDRVHLNYQLIGTTESTRVAAAESLRVFEVEKEARDYTVERLNVELSRQEQLAQAERAEVQSLVDYNSAIADLFQAMGTSLERNGIQFVVPPSPAE